MECEKGKRWVQILACILGCVCFLEASVAMPVSVQSGQEDSLEMLEAEEEGEKPAQAVLEEKDPAQAVLEDKDPVQAIPEKEEADPTQNTSGEENPDFKQDTGETMKDKAVVDGTEETSLPQAEALTSGGYEYKVSASGTVTITDYEGEEEQLVIPSTLDGKPVVSIASYAVYCPNLMEVTIPDSIQNIEPNAFYYCYAINKVIIKGKDTLIGDSAFYGVSKITFVCSLSSNAYKFAKEHNAKISLIDGINLSNAKVTFLKKSIAQKNAYDQSVYVKLNGRTLKEGSDYTCSWPSYDERGNVGTKTVTLTAVTGNKYGYTGSKRASYDVVPNAPTQICTTKNISSSSIQITWTKVSGASGYVIYRSKGTSKNYKKIAVIQKGKTNTYTDRKLKKGSRYNYQVAAFQKVQGKMYDSIPISMTAYTNSKKQAVQNSKPVKIKKRTIHLKAEALTGNYLNHDAYARVSGISDFFDSKGRYTIAYNSGKYVYISTLDNASLKIKKTLKIKKKHERVGSVSCGPDGNYYIVWGQRVRRGKIVLAVSKYSKSGKFIKSCNFRNTGELFDTQEPFDAGNCAVTYQGNILVCSYARLMNNGHQSNGVVSVDIKTMKALKDYENYVSHSFDQRVLALSNGDVLFANLGDAYPRGFDLEEVGNTHPWNACTFHFHGDSGLNWTEARLGGVGEVSSGIAMACVSAPSMNQNYKKENHQLFLQIVSPITKASILKGKKRKGTSCGKPYTDTGIQWLTNYKNASVVACNLVVMEKDRILILWEKETGNNIESYYMVLSASGKILQKATKIGNILLNECEEIKYRNGCVYWTTADGTKRATVYKLDIGK